ncbi:flagellar biosynthetic protein FliR [Desulfuromonas sp. AOP6]|uniref:flagellar biosynthetic protein FliR n=1 Tax=Desulfuromonas sp. AOP6 TaxID=1566351 RepID=UPI00127E98D6|nr:flagellar biosynthetic protein FliR [Desulfuromonas sp. AOP6]BCA79124.1 flagellar biosynthetic protein FliR [Desulfuromonas sp. AOP6]
MELPLIPVEQFQSFLICLARVGALIAALPVFSGGQTPMQLRVGLAVMVSLLVYPVVAPYIPAQSFHPVSLAVLVTGETLFGVLVAIIARLIFTAAEFGGTIIGFQMGFAAANVFDPQNQRQIALISQLQNVFAILVFLALDIHHIFLRAIVYSYELLPPGGVDFSGEAVPYLMTLTSGMFVLAVKFSAPILAVLLLSSFVLGILSRVFPQLNVFMISFPVNIGLSLIVMGLTLNVLVSMLGREFNALGDRFMLLFELL